MSGTRTRLLPAVSLMLAGITIAIMGACFMAYGAWSSARWANSVTTTGTVVATHSQYVNDHHHYRRVIQPDVEYTDMQGGRHRVWLRGVPHAPAQVGETWKVEYKKNDPSTARSPAADVKGPMAHYGGLGCLGVGGLLVVIGLVRGMVSGFVRREAVPSPPPVNPEPYAAGPPQPGPYQPSSF